MNFQQMKSSRYMQYFACIIASIPVAATGMAGSWASPSLQLLQSDDSPIGRPITDVEGSWIVSIYTLSAIPAPILAARSLDIFGRKKTLLFAALLILTQWIFIIFGKSFEALLTARCIGGISWGMTGMTCAIYIVEIAEADIRGKLNSYMAVMKTMGSVLVMTIGPYISYMSLAKMSAMLPIMCFCLFHFLPESPYYLVKSGDIRRAKKNIIQLSSNTANEQFIEERLTLIKNIEEADMSSKGTFLELFTNKKYAFSIFLLRGIKSLQTCSGSVLLGSYLQTIIALTDSGLSPQATSLIIGCIELPAVFISGLLVDRLGRKPLMIISAVGCGIALFGEGTYFYIQDYLKMDTSSLAWLPTTAAVLYWIAHSLGIMPLPYVLIGELFPTNIKAKAVAVGSIYGSIMLFLVSKFCKQLSNVLGIYTVFYIFTGTCIAGAIFMFVFLPETKGKNFNDIQELLKQRGNKKQKGQ